MGQDHEAYIAALHASGGVITFEAPRELRSGRESIAYFDHRNLPTEPEWRTVWYDDMLATLQETFSNKQTVLCNVDSLMSPFLTGTLANQGQYRQISYFSDDIEPFPYIRAGDSLVIIDDVYTQGDHTATDVIEYLRKRKKLRNLFRDEKKVHLLVGLVRGDLPTIQRELEEKGIILHWLITQDDVLQPRWNILTDEQRRFLEEEFPGIEERVMASSRRLS